MKVEYPVTWNLWKHWLLESLTKGSRLVFLILWTMFALIFCIWGLSDLENGSQFFLLFAVFCLYRAGFRHLIAAKKQYASLSTLFGGSDWLRSITISDETISIKDGTASIDIPTANLIQIKEKGDEVCLMMRNKMTVRLYKSSFVDGSWEACKELLTAGRN